MHRLQNTENHPELKETLSLYLDTNAPYAFIDRITVVEPADRISVDERNGVSR